MLLIKVNFPCSLEWPLQKGSTVYLKKSEIGFSGVFIFHFTACSVIDWFHKNIISVGVVA